MGSCSPKHPHFWPSMTSMVPIPPNPLTTLNIKELISDIFRSSSTSRPPYRRSMSLSPSRVDDFKYRETLAPVRTLIRESFRDDPSGGRGLNGHHAGDPHSPSSVRIGRRSPSVAKERTRDELIDSIVHTRTREHRVMPGFHNASDWEERKAMGIDCDKVQY